MLWPTGWAKSLTSDDPNNLIEEISTEYTPINFPSKRNSFSTDINDVQTTAAASDVTETHDTGLLSSTLFTPDREGKCESHLCLCPSARRSKRQPASSSVINPWQMLNVGSCVKLQQSGDSNEKFPVERKERSWIRQGVTHGTRKICLGNKTNHEREARRAPQSEFIAQRRLSGGESLIWLYL